MRGRHGVASRNAGSCLSLFGACPIAGLGREAATITPEAGSVPSREVKASYPWRARHNWQPEAGITAGQGGQKGQNRLHSRLHVCGCHQGHGSRRRRVRRQRYRRSWDFTDKMAAGSLKDGLLPPPPYYKDHVIGVIATAPALSSPALCGGAATMMAIRSAVAPSRWRWHLADLSARHQAHPRHAAFDVRLAGD